MLQPDLITILVAFTVTTFTLIILYLIKGWSYGVKQEVEKSLPSSSNAVEIVLPKLELKGLDELRAAILEFKGRESSEVDELYEKLSAAKESIKKLMEELEGAER
ncbi:MAG: hypothetical protein QXO01_05455 [Nitrososphaerota archaeon]